MEMHFSNERIKERYRKTNKHHATSTWKARLLACNASAILCCCKVSEGWKQRCLVPNKPRRQLFSVVGLLLGFRFPPTLEALTPDSGGNGHLQLHLLSRTFTTVYECEQAAAVAARSVQCHLLPLACGRKRRMNTLYLCIIPALTSAETSWLSSAVYPIHRLCYIIDDSYTRPHLHLAIAVRGTTLFCLLVSWSERLAHLPPALVIQQHISPYSMGYGRLRRTCTRRSND